MFREWRKRVGNEEADRVTKEATRRGTDFHEAAQAYLENKELDWKDYQPLTQFMFHSDASQTDLQKTNEKNGILDFMKIIEQMPEDFAMIEFNVNDIVRSGLVREYLVRKMAMGF